MPHIMKDEGAGETSNYFVVGLNRRNAGVDPNVARSTPFLNCWAGGHIRSLIHIYSD